ncbi:MAG TPA: cysteine hydrolase [archaeon]|nr:cysteine hydrolase [archaeon]
MIDKKIIDPKSTAILVIDVQNDYCSEKGIIAMKKKFDMMPIQKTIPKIEKFLEKAREKKVFIIWTRMIENPKYMAPNAAYKILSDPNLEVLCTPGTYGFQYHKIMPKKGETEVIKKSYDAFVKTNLNSILKKRKIKNVIVLGFYTSVCVDSTARTAFGLGYNVVIASDLVSMPKQRYDLHKASIKNMEIIFAHVMKSYDIIRGWK